MDTLASLTPAQKLQASLLRSTKAVPLAAEAEPRKSEPRKAEPAAKPAQEAKPAHSTASGAAQGENSIKPVRKGNSKNETDRFGGATGGGAALGLAFARMFEGNQ